MGKKFQHLKPGDLITAELMNAILDALNSLDARLTALGKHRASKTHPAAAPRRAAKRKATRQRQDGV
ncbi:MAG: hypothetical protein P4M04_16680 [Acidobacteriota bacterium]|nr:hypothetical protein [Acidobacteriota bacterium]